MALPQSFLDHLRTQGYHPRSDKHSKAIAVAMVEDLMAYCAEIAEEAAKERLVFNFNEDLIFGHTEWNTDLAIGPPPPGPVKGKGVVAGMIRATPATVRIAVEAKSVMTEHHKAVKNRKRDLEAHHAHVHDYDVSAIAGGIVVLNAAPTFVSPTRGGVEVTTHNNPDALIAHCINEVNNITMAGGTRAVGLDAKCALVIDMDNVNHVGTTYVTKKPAPQPGSPIHWDAFIQRMCNLYKARFR